ncbi:MAG: hypothetical protein WCE30_01680 [Mycobacterium sp.]
MTPHLPWCRAIHDETERSALTEALLLDVMYARANAVALNA